MRAQQSSAGESNDEWMSKKLPAHYSDGMRSCILRHLKRERKKNVLALFTPSADDMSGFKFVFSWKLTVHCLFHKELYFSYNSETFEFSHFFFAYHISPGGWDSSVGTATRYETEASGLNPSGGKILLTLPGRHWDQPSLVYNGYRGLLSG